MSENKQCAICNNQALFICVDYYKDQLGGVSADIEYSCLDHKLECCKPIY